MSRLFEHAALEAEVHRYCSRGHSLVDIPRVISKSFLSVCTRVIQKERRVQYARLANSSAIKQRKVTMPYKTRECTHTNADDVEAKA